MDSKIAVKINNEKEHNIYMRYLEDIGYKRISGGSPTSRTFEDIYPCVTIEEFGLISRCKYEWYLDNGYTIISVKEAMQHSAYGFYSKPTNDEIHNYHYDHSKKEFIKNTTLNPTLTPTMSLSQKINEMYFTEEVTQDAANTVKQLEEFQGTLSQLGDSVRNFENKVDLCKRRIKSEYDCQDPLEFEKYLKLGKDLLKVLAKHDYIKVGAKLTKEDKGIDVNDYLS